MLTDLVVEGLGVIDRADLALEGGSAALTGETGAGKTLVVAAAQLLLGDRADRGLVRDGVAEARVEGRFLIPAAHPAASLLEEIGFQGAGDEIEVVVTRTVAASGGSSKARINGRLVTLASLAEVTSTLMEIAGQHEHQRLARPDAGRSLLDAFAGPEALEAAAQVSDAVKRAARAKRELETLRDGERSRSREADVLQFEIKEIEAASIRAGESAELHALAERLEHAEEIATGLSSATEMLRGEGGGEETVGAAESEIRRLVDRDPDLAPLTARLEAARYEIADIASELQARLVAPDPEALESTRSRLALLARLRRKYGSTDEEVLAYLGEARAKLARVEGSDEEVERLEREHAELLREAEEAAERLTTLRTAAAPKLAAAAEEWLRRLALPDMRFEIALEGRPLSEGGAEDVSFLIAPNPGEPARPVAKSASGGELSRISLALSLVTTIGDVRTMIFDEVDAGVGGEAARAVGAALGRLAREQELQVIVVTHLPQVAAFADHQYQVKKESHGGRTVATVARVEGDERVAELSRMLAGMPDSDVAKQHARELLEVAAVSGPPGTTVS